MIVSEIPKPHIIAYLLQETLSNLSLSLSLSLLVRGASAFLLMLGEFLNLLL